MEEVLSIALKRHSVKIHKPTVWIVLVVVVIFVVVTLTALEKSAKKHDRKLMPSKQGIEVKKEAP